MGWGVGKELQENDKIGGRLSISEITNADSGGFCDILEKNGAKW
jgi:hypothetical protein